MIRAKLVLRSVFSRPLRTLIVIFSLAAAAFAAMYCISGVNTAKNSLSDYFRQNFGEADIVVSGTKAEVKLDEKELPEGSRMLGVCLGGVTTTTPNPRYVNYVASSGIAIMGMDTEKAAAMKLISYAYPTDGGATITQSYADHLGKGVGDTFTITGKKDIQYKLKILAVVSPSGIVRSSGNTIIVTPELCRKISGAKSDSINSVYVDVPDDVVAECVAEMSASHPDQIFISTASNDSDAAMNSMLSVYYLIFAVVFLMVCFIVASMSKHIINERMALTGTLRSIGGSIFGTGLLLLSESVFYGLCGGILGTIAFMPLRGSLELSYFTVAGEEFTRSDGITPVSVTLVILSVILIQCFFSAGAIIKAARTPVRDIIFGTKEAAYHPSRALTVSGAVLLVAGIALNSFSEDFLMTVAAAFFSTIGAVLVFPWLISLISKGLAALFGKLNKPLSKLAVKEIATTKSSISSAGLILSAMSLTIAVMSIAVSLVAYIDSDYYNTDIMIESASQDGKLYDMLPESVDGIENIEKLYFQNLSYETKAEVNGEKRDLIVMGFENSGFRYFTGIRDCPQGLGEAEIAVDKVFASRLSLKVGDTVKLGLKSETYLPRQLSLKVKSLVDSGYFNTNGNTVLINADLYRKIYYDKPTTILIKTRPEKKSEVLQTLKTTMADDPMSIMTTEEYMSQRSADMQSLLMIVYSVVILGIALSLMGTTSNILIGFEQSRRKLAVFYSTLMSRSNLKKLIILETLLMCSVSCIAAVIYGCYFLGLISKSLDLLSMSVPLVQAEIFAPFFGLAGIIILSLAAVRPVVMISRMDMAEEIKTNAD